MSSVDVEDLVSAYLVIRSERDKNVQQFEATDAALKADMAEIEVMLLAMCNEMNASSIKTSEGTVMRKLSERYICNDWDNFYKFVLENQAPQLLEKRIHQSNFKQFYSELDGLPPGVNVMREFGITIRKPSSKEV